MSNVVTFMQRVRPTVNDDNSITENWMPTYREFRFEELAMSYARNLCDEVGVKDIRVLEDIKVPI